MPVALVIIGMILLVAGIRDNVGNLGRLVAADFSGPNNFFYWAVSVIIVGAIGYVPALRNPSRAFLILILLVMVLSNRGFFTELQKAVSSVQAPQPTGQTSSQAQVAASGGGGGGGIVGAVSGLSGFANTFATFGKAVSALGVIGL